MKPLHPSKVAWTNDVRYGAPVYHGNPLGLLQQVQEAGEALRAAAEAYRQAIAALPGDLHERPATFVPAVPLKDLPSRDDLAAVLDAALGVDASSPGQPVALDRLTEVIAEANLLDEVGVADLVERLTSEYAARHKPHVDYHLAQARKRF